ncbi:hypothetical protein YQE_11259, partial [Dendroctonus ponderosae]
MPYYGTYDFIIVGGGAAGGVLANRLTEIENFTVLVVEAGKVDPPISRITGLAAYLKNSDWNWGYWSTVQTKGCLASPDQKCRFTAGKGLGGGSSINWAMHVRDVTRHQHSVLYQPRKSNVCGDKPTFLRLQSFCNADPTVSIPPIHAAGMETLHPVGTTAMGTNTSTSVVSSELKVHGIDQLRVVDAGIMPTTVSGHTTAAVVMIAEKAADLIKADYGYVNNTAI